MPSSRTLPADGIGIWCIFLPLGTIFILYQEPKKRIRLPLSLTSGFCTLFFCAHRCWFKCTTANKHQKVSKESEQNSPPANVTSTGNSFSAEPAECHNIMTHPSHYPQPLCEPGTCSSSGSLFSGQFVFKLSPYFVTLLHCC